MQFDPWLSAPVERGSTTKKKMARLAGKEPHADKVQVLIKLHNWSGRAIYIYNLTMPDSAPPEKRMRHIPQPSEEVWKRYEQLGVEIPHPGKIQATAVTQWVDYGRKVARTRGLKVEE